MAGDAPALQRLLSFLDRQSHRRRRRGALHADGTLSPLWQVRIEEAEHVRAMNHADAFLFLQIGNLPVEIFHLRPVHLRTKMMLGVVTIIEKEPVVDFAVAAHAPRDRLVRISAVMPVITIQVTKAMAEIEKRQEIK